MYKKLIRPILFLFKPEFIHNISFFSIKLIFKIPLIKFLSKRLFVLENKKLEVNLIGKKFKNRIGLAAGFYKNAELLNQIEYFGFSHVEIGTITPLPQDGNPKPRLFRLASENALINRMGFNNDGVDIILKRIRSYKGNLIIGANIGKNKTTHNNKAIDDYLFCFKKLRNYVDYFVINVSSPNTPGLRKLQNKESLDFILEKIQLENKSNGKPVPVFIKIAPDLSLSEIDGIIEVSIKNSINGVIATNTTISRKGLKSNKIKNIGEGGLSGKPLSEKSNSIIKYLKKNAKNNLVIIGVGGVFTFEDVHDKIKSGADLVQVYTGWIYEGPSMIKKINNSLLKLEKENY